MIENIRAYLQHRPKRLNIIYMIYTGMLKFYLARYLAILAVGFPLRTKFVIRKLFLVGLLATLTIDDSQRYLLEALTPFSGLPVFDYIPSEHLHFRVCRYFALIELNRSNLVSQRYRFCKLCKKHIRSVARQSTFGIAENVTHCFRNIYVSSAPNS